MPEHRLLSVLLGIALASGISTAIADEILRDPTRPYVVRATQAVAVPKFTVNAIFVSGERRIAIVNGQRVRVGGQVGRATVIAIEKDQLTLRLDGKRITAELAHGVARQ